MRNVTYFDVEYANCKNKSICQIGIMCEDYSNGNPVYPELDIYINPEDGFDYNCVKIHGITSARVEKEPTFPEVWEKIEKYFTQSVVVGHNVRSADLDALVKVLKRYNLDIPEMYYICTYELAKKYVPRCCVKGYSMSCLCEYFDIDIDSEHNAFDDACACSDLFKTLVDHYNIDVDSHIKKYEFDNGTEYSAYISSPTLRKSISEFYGIIQGFSIDKVINEEETKYIANWKEANSQYINQPEVADIICVIDNILKDDRITIEEITVLQNAVKSYLDDVTTSEVTLATQVLDGILKGITVDGEISEDECKNLRRWLYDNIYLSNHFPFDKTIALVDKVLEDSVITKEEADYMTTVINEMLNPVEALKELVNSVSGKHVCLSGTFAFGPKSAVEKYIVDRGGVIDSSVKKTTDVLMVGDMECMAYSNGTYGTKVKKAIEYNNKGCNIQILKESDFFAKVK